MKISVIGCGYLGAVHAACMASLGYEVIGIDVDASRVAALNAGRPPFYEPGFPEVLGEALATGRLRFAMNTDPGVIADADVHFIAVGTPQSSDGEAADVSYVDAAVDFIMEAIKHSTRDRSTPPVVVGKSTVPVGTAARLQTRLDAVGALLVWNPEFLREGHAVADTLCPDRIVYGLPDKGGEVARRVLDEVYAEALSAGIPQVLTDFATAELVKVAANSFLATKISFINAMAQLCEATGGDVTQLAEAIGHDKRIGKHFLDAGIGFGGGCLPKDIRAFAARAGQLDIAEVVDLLHTVDAINRQAMRRVVAACERELGDVHSTHIGILGGAFKANSDDIRESPALLIASELAARGARVSIYDPQAGSNIAAKYPALNVVDSLDEAVTGADMTLVLTEWKEFRELSPADIAKHGARRRILDGRNILDPAEWKDAGWSYTGMGRA